MSQQLIELLQSRVAVVALLVAAGLAVAAWGITRLIMDHLSGEKRKIQKRLNTGPQPTDRVDYAQITLERLPSELSYWESKLQYSFPDMTPARLLALSMMLFLVTMAIVAVLMDSWPLGVVLGIFAGFTPMIVVNVKCNKRKKKLSEQLPAALDFLTRVLRAGHSLSTGLQMVGEELPDPIGAEFRQCYAEHSVGQPLDQAIKNMSTRIQSGDFAFFASALLIQRQTGGDLAEILGNISTMIRNRMKLERHVQALSAEGRLTGYILMAFPFIMYAVISVMNPSYSQELIKTTIGQVLLVIGLIMLVIGFFLIRKIVTVKV